MARAAGVHREVSRVTEKAMRGDLDFEDSLRQRTALLKGLTTDQLEAVRIKLSLSEGAVELVETLKRLGFKLGVVSGGFGFYAESLKDHLGLDFAYANKLEIKDGVVTGRIEGDIIDDAAKARIVNTVASEMRVPLDQTVAVGDGANDRLMLGQAGLGIAYNAHAGVARSAVMNVGKTRLMNILYTLGISEEDITGG
jgi:phosphoserine phosphatase